MVETTAPYPSPRSIYLQEESKAGIIIPAFDCVIFIDLIPDPIAYQV